MKIIINADDLGYSSAENSEIFSLLDQGKITSATIMSNAPVFEKAAAEVLLRQSDKKMSFGIHLNLIEFRPLTNTDIFKELGLVDIAGEFCSLNLHLTTKKQKEYFQMACFNELKEQVVKALDYGIQISHFDSHQHVHTKPEFLFMLKKLMKMFSIQKWRITKNWYTHFDKPSSILEAKKIVWNFYLRHICFSKTTDYFTSFITFLKQNIKEKNKELIVELMTHPGKEWSKEETNLLKTDWKRSLSYPVELISYKEL